MESELNDLFDNLNVPLLERRRIELSLCLLYKILTLIGGGRPQKKVHNARPEPLNQLHRQASL